MTDGRGGPGGVLRLRNLAMIENIRRAEDPAWRERLERQQVVARCSARPRIRYRRCMIMPTRSRQSCDGRLRPGNLQGAARSLMAERRSLR
jgi:hypothetical protein